MRLIPLLPFVFLGTVVLAQDAPETDALPDVLPETTEELSDESLEDTPDADAPEEPMTLARLTAIVRAIDPEARIGGTAMELSIDDVPLLIVTDPFADRMRAMVPIRSAAGMSREELERVMQANFDTALDARYAVARGRLWSVFIHPLAALERDQLLSALVQTVNVARTYGQSYSGGALNYGGGDSQGIFRELLEELQKRGQEL